MTVSIREPESGFDQILSRVLAKFASKSFEEIADSDWFIAQRLVEAHGGKIWAENNFGNRLEGSGATFRFSLALSNIKHEDIPATIDN